MGTSHEHMGTSHEHITWAHYMVTSHDRHCRHTPTAIRQVDVPPITASREVVLHNCGLPRDVRLAPSIPRMDIVQCHTPPYLTTPISLGFSAPHHCLPKPPAWASIRAADTGVPTFKPSSTAASDVNP